MSHGHPPPPVIWLLCTGKLRHKTSLGPLPHFPHYGMATAWHKLLNTPQTLSFNTPPQSDLGLPSPISNPVHSEPY